MSKSTKRAVASRRRIRVSQPNLRTWGDIKRMIEAAGVVDDDFVFMVDLGPEVSSIRVDRDDGMVEISEVIPPMVWDGRPPG